MNHRTGFFSADSTYYEDGSPEQEEFLSRPITEEEEGTLLGYLKQIYQQKLKSND